jgi:hypothetical protein
VNVVRVRVLLCGVLGVLDRVQLVAVRQVSVMAGFFVLAGFRVFGRFAVMTGGFVEVLGRFMMVMMNFVLVAHGKLLHLR